MNNTTKTLLVSVLLTSLCSCNKKDEKSDTEKRIDEILSQMTLEEKVGQLHQISTIDKYEKLFDEAAAGNIGSIFNEVTPKRANELQRKAVEGSRLGIP